jgi:phosphoenolpyruvate synthase/pyruvate phosphate dikinase
VTMVLRTIYHLHEDGAQDPALVGGKAANLGILASRHRVPPGFCLTVDAFRQAVAGGTPLGSDAPGPPSIPDHLRRALAAAYTDLATRVREADVPVAVRSSALDEDGSGDSFAGQLETYLNVRGLEALEEAIVRCWASGQSERARSYRNQRNLASDDVPVAVLVQQLIAADTSAIAFSANPVTGDRGEVVINASYGLGESIVGGTATPDTHVVHKDSLTPISMIVGEKERMTIRVPEGTREVPVPRSLRTKTALSDAQAIEIARLAIDLEAAMGHPVDIECAHAQGHLYLLQCRPITTLSTS